MEALFARAGDRLVPTELARGPWDPGALHGGPTAGLVVGEVERHLPAGAFQVARLTLELVRPVPVEPLAVDVATVRPGRKVSLIQAEVRAAAGTVARAVVLAIRTAEVALPPPMRPVAPPSFPDGSEDVIPPVDGWTAFHNRAVEMRWVRGVWRQPGPAAVWMRLRVPVVAGEPTTPAMRAAAFADFGNGISSELEFGAWRFLNPELTVHLARMPEGEWICVDAHTLLGDRGAGMAQSTLFDRGGPFGRGAQSLLVEPA